MAEIDPSKVYFSPYSREERDVEIKAVRAAKRVKNKHLVIIVIGFIIAVAAIPAIAMLIHRLRFDTTFTAFNLPDYSEEFHSNINEDPIQIDEISSKEAGEINGIAATINYEAYYDITGIVTSVYDYYGFDFLNTYVPRDVCLVWGNLKDSLSDPDIRYWQNNRHCYISYQNQELDEYSHRNNSPFISKYSSLKMSNNHIIPANKDIRNQILGLNRGDKVRLVGYLVNVYTQHQGNINSSFSRYDAGDGACEVIFVTKVEKN